MRTLFKALLAATALLPVAVPAGAQEWSGERGGDRSQRGDRVDRGPVGGGGGDERRGGPGRDRGGDGGPSRQAPDQPRGGWNGSPDRQPAPRPDANRADPGPGGPGRPGWEGRRPDRPGGGFASGRGPDRPDRQPGFDGNRPRIDPGRGDGRWSDQRNWNGNAPGWQGQRAWSQRDGRYDDRRFGDRGRDGGWRNGGRPDDRGAWNRTWRNDGRYDWNRYRAGNRNAYRLPRYYAPYGWNGGYRRFSVGVRLSSVLWDQNYWIADPYAYRLPEAYRPYRWVRYYNDALLVDVRYGEVIDVVHDIFW